MPYARISRPCTLPISAQNMWELLSQTETLRKVTDGYMSYQGHLPERWEVGQEIDIKPKFVKGLLSYLPSGKHIVIVMQVDPKSLIIETMESGGVVKRWNHFMKIEPVNDLCCRYTDDVLIEAGWATEFVASLADDMYRYRHAKWHELAVAQLQNA
jgi:hypothetical protein